MRKSFLQSLREPVSNFFRQPTVYELRQRQLDEARRLLDSSLTSAEYHTKMAEYAQGIIDRLTVKP